MASKAEDFEAIFAELRRRMLRAAPDMVVVTDTPGALSLNAPWPPPAKPMWFGKVEIGKAYVSYHLMPIYVLKALAEQVTPALKARMQGKSCFNVKTADPAVFDALEALTAAAARAFAEPIIFPRKT